MAILNTLISEEIRSAPYYPEYVAKVTKYQHFLAREVVSDDETPAPKPGKGAKPKTPRKPKLQSTSSQPPKPKPAPAKPQEKKRKLVMETTDAPSLTKRSKAGKVVKKRTLKSSQQLVDKFVDEGVLMDEPRFEDEEADIIQKVMEESLKDAYPAPRGPLPLVVIREPEPGKYEPLPEVQGKGKEKVSEEQAAQVLLNLQTPKKKNPAEHETESNNKTSREGQAGSDPRKLVEGQAGSDPGVAADSRIQPSHVVHARPNLEHMNLEVSDTSPQPNLEQMDEEFTLTAYLNVQENLKILIEGEFLAEKSQEDEPEKTNTKVEVQSMVMVPIHQDTLEQTVEYIDKQEIDEKIEETVKEAITASVQYAMRAPLRARFKDLPTSDMKEILLQRMLKENYDKGHKDHRIPYEALQTSILHDESEQFDADKSEERKKIKSKQDSPKTPPGSPPPPLPPTPPSGASGAFGTTGASDFAQDPLPPPSSPTPNPDDQSPGSAAPGSSKTAAATAYTTDDIGVFIDWFCKKQGITELTPEHLEGLAYEVVKAFHLDVIHLQFQMEECHKLLTNQVDDRLLSKGDRIALSITKMKAAYYPNVGLEQMVPDQIWIKEECMYDISATYGISHWWSPKPPTAKGQEDSLLCCQPMDQESDKYGMQMIMHFNEIHKFNDGTLQQIDEALNYRVKEFRVNKVNLGLDTRFWTMNDVIKSKQFMFAIQKRLKLRRIFQNLETFVGGRIREGDYRLLQRIE
ncbi:hypothetical protein Tco_1508506 [Tanacetum coccineum]